ncbi:MAG TPA: YwqG family protein, partial [Thermoanaerobaculia bacterium]|nr:YwqG family protein [Thermoanaerobaculia bacterium]
MSAAADARVEEVFHRYHRTGVLLHVRYPPHAGGPTNSRFGGLPSLPDHYEWPRTPNDVPLHFLAQIDCADIPFPTVLPDRGVLFFFGRDDEEQIWDRNEPEDCCRVIYAPDATAETPRRDVPDDLPPIGDSYPREAAREFLVGEEDGPSVHVEWPIQPLPIDTWPDVLFGDYDEPEEDGDDPPSVLYKERLKELRAEAFAKATGHGDFGPHEINRDSLAGRAIFGYAEEGPEAYPQRWITLQYAVRALLHRPVYFGGPRPGTEEWLRRSNEFDLDEPVPEEDRRAFREWLIGLGPSYDQSAIGGSAGGMVFLSMVATLRAWAGDPVRAARIAPRVYEVLHYYFSGVTDWGVNYSQMLGHAPSAQSPMFPEEPTVVLLNLTSDRGLGWSFGDGGYCTFWIEPEDLAAR